MGIASGYADWRHGRSRGDFRLVLSRAHRRCLERKRHRSRGAADIDRHQLSWRACWQQRAKRSHAAKNWRNRGAGNHRLYCWRSCTGALDTVAGKTILIRCSQKHWRGDGPDRFRVRRLADGHFCRR